MATAKKSVSAPAAKRSVKAAAPAKAPVKKVVGAKSVASKTAGKSGPAPLKPIKTAFNKTSLLAQVAEVAAVELKAVKAVMGALEATILASIHKKGLGEFTLPGLLKITAQSVPAKKKRLGKDPFTGQERMFAAKPATTKIKTRALKKLKDAAL
ncbi:HU family DNA-binding protein [Pseudaquabacterium pictum]|uniref:DNA-binding protein n=1 Tax=Pseudaquabacterium pictum TaxID=2315236 RepID=A0A480AXB3_9BURK|nr:HU family DNA-binding protein [Rubrivivax pictus]GCL65536.1 DNA-binding protein [Rubrivivax pictus]